MGELIFVLAGIGVWAWQQRRRRVSDVRAAIDLAVAQGDWPRVEQLMRLALPHAQGGAPEAGLRLLLAQALDHQERHGEAADVLDPALARHLPPRQMAAWHNTRGLALALAGRCDEADDELELAEVVVGDDEDLDGRTTYACVVGNRGIVELQRGRLDRARELLAQARGMFQEVLGAVPDSDAYERLRREWDAEHCWWLAEIAARAGDDALARERYADAARLDGTQYGDKARKRLVS